jgi:hypothetical protein
MAQPTYEYSGACYTATSGQTVFPLTSTTGNPIGYLSPTHIHVRTSTDSGETWSILPADTGWTFADPATSIVLVTPATVGEWVDIQRKTPIDTDWIDFQAGSLLTAGQLNEAETFSLYCDQEIVDGIRDGELAPIDPGVTKIIAGDNIQISPSDGTGAVTITGQSGGGGVPEAPINGNTFGRKDAAWVVVGGGGGGDVLSVNGQTGAVILGVEQLADFAYYPASNQVTLLGPCISSGGDLSGTEYRSGANPSLYFVFPKTNTQVYDVLSQLSSGDDITVCYYSSVGTVYTEVETTFSSIGNNGGTVPSWVVQFNTAAPGAVLGNYPVVFKSALITNGQAPITTGQALIYDQVTEKWRPEDIAAELNISALPALP